ncbi:c-type cytochrome [Halomonas piscis]|uniref:c-type cytochrome n=1 Tax=Halomonas piscis TaxID=3031727 RepID=UPI0028A13D72|nr:c-type cytochrome [Halomonas piscis]
MNKKMLGGLGLLLGAGVYAGAATALEGDPEKGEEVARVCVACHQEDGMGKNNPDTESWPRLAGLPEAYMVKQLHDMKADKRHNASMAPILGTLDDQDMADVAAYYAELEPWPELPTAYHAADPDSAAEWLAERGDWEDGNFIPACSQCHGPNGQGVGDSFPPLAGQHAAYLKTQLEHWREGQRHNDPNELMAGVANRLDDSQIDMIAEYYATLPERLEARGNEQEESAQ